MDALRSLKKLANLIIYILERRPDEFGLLPDNEGYVKIKSLIRAVNEEEGFKYVRPFHIDDIIASLPDARIEIRDAFIRAKNIDNLPKKIIAANPPKLLYTCVRKKAHVFALENGIHPVGNEKVVLSATREMAERIGKRFDQFPVLLTVHIQKALDAGVIFHSSGELYCSGHIPPSCFTGPPPPKQKEETGQAEKQIEFTPKRMPGSYIMNIGQDEEKKRRTELQRKRKEVGWKKERKRASRIKY
jgi:putative RNA 2'-phosphotransferase